MGGSTHTLGSVHPQDATSTPSAEKTFVGRRIWSQADYDRYEPEYESQGTSLAAQGPGIVPGPTMRQWV
jgi:hypothetical protein